jgi:hypothetical protein
MFSAIRSDCLQKIMKAIQNDTVTQLAKRGFIVNRVDEADEDGYQQAVCFMSKRISKFQTFYAEVDEDGSVNGQSLGIFLNGIKR